MVIKCFYYIIVFYNPYYTHVRSKISIPSILTVILTASDTVFICTYCKIRTSAHLFRRGGQFLD